MYRDFIQAHKIRRLIDDLTYYPAYPQARLRVGQVITRYRSGHLLEYSLSTHAILNEYSN